MKYRIFKSLLYPTPLVSEKQLHTSLLGKTCLVTGATSGIGRALAEILITHGAHLILLARDREVLDDLRAKATAHGVVAKIYAVDFRDHQALEEVIQSLTAEQGSIHYFFANAGKSIHRSLHDAVDRLHDYDRTTSINYRAHVALLLALYPTLKQSRGTIVYSNSVSLLFPPAPGWSAYHASKGAMDIWLRTARVEWYKEGIRVKNAYLPLVHTSMSAPNTAYQKLPGYTAEEAALQLLRLAIHNHRYNYIPWWARVAAPLARLLHHPIEYFYRHQ